MWSIHRSPGQSENYLQCWGNTKGDVTVQWFLRIGTGLLLALGIAMTAFAATPDGKTAATAIPISSSKAETGSLTGSSAGAFEFFTFEYPGDGSVGTITLSISPNDPATANAVGVNLYQGSNQLATMNAVGATPGTNSVTFSSTTMGPVLAQVYNYNQGETVSFSLTLSGVAQTTAPPAPQVTLPTPTPVAAGQSPSKALPLTTSASGTLAGNPAGSFAFYTFNYPGDGSTQSVTLNYSPGGVDVGNAITLSVFQNGTQLVSDSGDHASAPGQLTVSFSSTTAGPVLVQIGNYNPSPTITYTISR
jgi:hypothetical protein